MKWLYHIKYKIRAVFGLASIIVVILVGNFVLRGKITELDRSMSSIMEDRLKPSAYIFELTHALYEKRLLLLDSIGLAAYKIERHNAHIASLIQSYEHTYLTKEEEKQWKALRTHLQLYNEYESRILKGIQLPVDHQVMNKEFDEALKNLNQLSDIQIGEGHQLRIKSKGVVDSSLAFSSLEMALLIVLGLMTMAILSISDHVLFNRKQQRQNLN